MNCTYDLIFDCAYDVLIQKGLLSSSCVLKYCFGAVGTVVNKVRINLMCQSGKQIIEISKFQLTMSALWTTKQ